MMSEKNFLNLGISDDESKDIKINAENALNWLICYDEQTDADALLTIFLKHRILHSKTNSLLLLIDLRTGQNNAALPFKGFPYVNNIKEARSLIDHCIYELNNRLLDKASCKSTNPQGATSYRDITLVVSNYPDFWVLLDQYEHKLMHLGQLGRAVNISVILSAKTNKKWQPSDRVTTIFDNHIFPAIAEDPLSQCKHGFVCTTSDHPKGDWFRLKESTQKNQLLISHRLRKHHVATHKQSEFARYFCHKSRQDFIDLFFQVRGNELARIKQSQPYFIALKLIQTQKAVTYKWLQERILDTYNPMNFEEITWARETTMKVIFVLQNEGFLERENNKKQFPVKQTN